MTHVKKWDVISHFRVQSHLSELDGTQRNIEPIYLYIRKSRLGEGPEGRGCKEARKREFLLLSPPSATVLFGYKQHAAKVIPKMHKCSCFT